MENKGFKIICNECGNEDIEINYDSDYDYDDNLIITGQYLYCPKCGNSENL